MATASTIPKALLLPNPKARLFDQVRELMRFHHYSLRTEKAYLQWMRRYLVFHRATEHTGPNEGWRHPKELGAPEINAFLSHLTLRGNVAASTQNQALNALVFLYEKVLLQPLGDLGEFARVTRPPRVPLTDFVLLVVHFEWHQLKVRYHGVQLRADGERYDVINA